MSTSTCNIALDSFETKAGGDRVLLDLGLGLSIAKPNLTKWKIWIIPYPFMNPCHVEYGCMV